MEKETSIYASRNASAHADAFVTVEDVIKFIQRSHQEYMKAIQKRDNPKPKKPKRKKKPKKSKEITKQEGDIIVDFNS